MTEIKKLHYDLAMQAAVAKTIVDCQRDKRLMATPAIFLANFKNVYEQFENESSKKQIDEIAKMIGLE